MPTNRLAYHAAINRQKDTLDAQHPGGALFITSVDNWAKGSTAGTVAETNTLIAATAFQNGTARLSTDEEIADFHRRSETNAVILNAQVQLRRETPPILGTTLVSAR